MLTPVPDKRIERAETVLNVGPTPPAHGISVLTELLLQSGLKESFEVVHLDTADRRTLDNVGRFEFRNVALALYYGARFQWLPLSRQPALVYMPVSESRPGFVWDSLFLLPSRLQGVPVVLHLHGGYLDTLYAERGTVFQWLMRFCIGHAVRAIVLSDSFRGKFAGLGSALHDDIAGAHERLIGAIQFVVHNRIPGSSVECGVWRGGSMMAAALALTKAGDTTRELHLFDTFEGMPKPTAADVDLNGHSAGRFRKLQTGPDTSNFWRATLEVVRVAMNSTGYDQGLVSLGERQS